MLYYSIYFVEKQGVLWGIAVGEGELDRVRLLIRQSSKTILPRLLRWRKTDGEAIG